MQAKSNGVARRNDGSGAKRTLSLMKYYAIMRRASMDEDWRTTSCQRTKTRRMIATAVCRARVIEATNQTL